MPPFSHSVWRGRPWSIKWSILTLSIPSLDPKIAVNLLSRSALFCICIIALSRRSLFIDNSWLLLIWFSRSCSNNKKTHTHCHWNVTVLALCTAVFQWLLVFRGLSKGNLCKISKGTIAWFSKSSTFFISVFISLVHLEILKTYYPLHIFSIYPNISY